MDLKRRTGSADLTLSSNSFPNVGFAPEAVGVAFSLKEGEKTAPFATDNGVIIIDCQYLEVIRKY